MATTIKPARPRHGLVTTTHVPATAITKRKIASTKPAQIKTIARSKRSARRKR